MNINDYIIILVVEPTEYPTRGFQYIYYILFEDDTMLPLIFFSQAESDIDKHEFNGVVSFFELV